MRSSTSVVTHTVNRCSIGCDVRALCWSRRDVCAAAEHKIVRYRRRVLSSSFQPAYTTKPAPQDWREAAENGHRALASIHAQLEDLQSDGAHGSSGSSRRHSSSTPAAAAAAAAEPLPVLENLMKQAPSFALQRYLAASEAQSSAHAAALPPADALHGQYTLLQDCMQQLQLESRELAAAWEQHAATLSSTPQQHSYQQQPPQQQQGEDQEAADAGGIDSSRGAAQGARAARSWDAAEWLLLLSSVAASVAKSTDCMVRRLRIAAQLKLKHRCTFGWGEGHALDHHSLFADLTPNHHRLLPTLSQAQCAAAVSLATPAAELESYAQLWELRPFVDDAAVNAVIEAALTAQRKREQQQAGGVVSPLMA